jgi:hypothetical protein
MIQILDNAVSILDVADKPYPNDISRHLNRKVAVESPHLALGTPFNGREAVLE